MPELYQHCLHFLAALYLSVIVHEAGHALVGKALGFVVTSVGLGTARPFLVVPVGRTRLYLGLGQPFQGITFAFLPRYDPSWRRLAAFVAGGVAANALGAALALCLALRLPAGGAANFWGMFAAVNAFQGLANIIPFRFNVGAGMLSSDGRIILEAIRTGSMTPHPPDVIQTATGCRPLWRATGDRRMDRLYTLCAASSWLDLGATTKAEALFAEAVSIAGPHPHIDWLEAVVRTNLALARGEGAAAGAALAHAARLGEPAAAEGRYLLDLLRASLLQVEGEPGAALAAFEGLALDPVGRRRPDLGLGTLTSHLHAACRAGDGAAVVTLRAGYESRRHRPSPQHDLHVYGALARFASGRGADARDDYRRAMRAIAALAAPWRDAGDKAAFVEAQRGLIAEAEQVLDAEGMAPLLEAIGTPQPVGGLVARDQSYRRWSLRLLLVNAASLASLVLLTLAIGRPQGAPAGFLAVLLAFFTLLGASYLLFDRAVGRFLPSLRQFTGFILLALAITPWFGGLLFGFLAIFLP